VNAAIAALPAAGRRSPRRVLRTVAGAVASHVLEQTQTCRVLMETRALAAHEPAIAAAVQATDARTHEQLESLIAAGVEAGEWPADTDPALASRLFTAGLYGLMAQWHLAPGSFSWDAAAAALASCPGPGPAGGVSETNDRVAQPNQDGGVPR
jgi:BetI-type transcriptional repressor, C-terminal